MTIHIEMYWSIYDITYSRWKNVVLRVTKFQMVTRETLTKIGILFARVSNIQPISMYSIDIPCNRLFLPTSLSNLPKNLTYNLPYSTLFLLSTHFLGPSYLLPILSPIFLFLHLLFHRISQIGFQRASTITKIILKNNKLISPSPKPKVIRSYNIFLF